MESEKLLTLDETVVEAEVLTKEVGPVIDNALRQAAVVAAAIVDDPSRERAVDMAVQVRDVLTKAKAWRDRYYDPVYRAAENLRSFVDPRVKQGKAILDTISAGVSQYDLKKRREAQLAKERAEAEARRLQEEAARKQREAEEAERRAKAAAEAEARRKKEAEEAEARRVQAEADARARQEAEARRLEQEERTRKIKEEEDARIRHAEEARDVGNTHKVETILDRPTPIAPVAASPQVAADQETLRIEQELAAKTAAEKAERERLASEEARRRQDEESARAAKARRDADAAKQTAAAAAAALAAVSSVTAKRPDDRTRKNTRWRWDLTDFKALVKAVHEGRAPVQYLGFDPDHPEDFRPTAINQDVQKLKGEFSCSGIRAFPQEDTTFLSPKKARAAAIDVGDGDGNLEEIA